MKHYQNHLLSNSSSLRDGLIAINKINDEILCLLIINEKQQLVGTLTDGDIRRALISGVSLDDSVELAMNMNFAKLKHDDISPNEIKKHRITGIKLLPYVDENSLILKVYNLKVKHSILPVDAVLMAGGKGERLRPLTEHVPKPLLKIGNKAIIDYNIDRLLRYGIEHINVTVNYLAEQIEDHFSEEIDGIRVQCIREPEFLGTIGAIKYINNFHYDTILVMNSDLFTNIDLEEFYRDFSENDADISIAAVPFSVSVPYGIFELDNNNILGLKEKPTYNYFANGGIYLIKRKFLELIPTNTFYNITDLIDQMIQSGYKVIRFPLIGYWIDVGKPEEFKKVQELANHFKL